MDVPIMYRGINIANSARAPYAVHTMDNATAQFYNRYLMKRAISAIELTIPEEWPLNYVQYVLFGFGFGAVLDVPRYGVIFQGCTFCGRDVYYQPTRVMTANPLFTAPANGWKIGENCALIKLQPDYTGVMDIVENYAARLALAYEAWQLNTQNSKLAYVLGAENKGQAASFQKLFDVIQSGVPAVATGQSMFTKDGKPKWFSFTNDLHQNYIAPDISADMRSIMAEFDSFVGIPSNPNSSKRERQIVDEVNANNVETDTLLDLMVETLNESFKVANDMYDLQLRAAKKYPVADEFKHINASKQIGGDA